MTASTNSSSIAGPLLFALLGLVLLAWSAVKIAASRRRSRSWRRTIGQVTGNTIQGAYQINIAYTFHAAGDSTPHGGFHSAPFADEPSALRYARRYPIGGPARVYYDPAAPHENNTLDASSGPFPLLALIGLAFLFGPAAAIANDLGGERPATAILGLFGLTLLAASVVAFRDRAAEFRTWHSTPGRVEKSEVRKLGHLPGALAKWDDEVAEIVYRYQVGNLEFRGGAVTNRDDYHLQSDSYRRTAARRMAARYPAGGTVQVWYDPQDPHQALLERPSRLHWGALALAALGAVLCAVPVVVWLGL